MIRSTYLAGSGMLRGLVIGLWAVSAGAQAPPLLPRPPAVAKPSEATPIDVGLNDPRAADAKAADTKAVGAGGPPTGTPTLPPPSSAPGTGLPTAPTSAAPGAAPVTVTVPVVTPPAASIPSMTVPAPAKAALPSSAAAAGSPRTTVTYSLQVSDSVAVKDLLTAMYGPRAEIAFFDQSKSLVVTAPFEVQREIDGITTFLDRQARKTEAGADPSGLVGRYLSARENPASKNKFAPFPGDGGATNPADASVVVQLETMRAAKSEQEQAAARVALRQLLQQKFDADMATRQTKLAEIEARVSTLRSQIAARSQAKERIIDLQIQVLENEAAGLGFPHARSGDTSRSVGAESTKPTPAEALHGYLNNLLDKPRTESNEDHFRTQQKAATLQQLGRWAISPDRKMYAYLDDESKSETPRDAALRVVDSRTGKAVALAIVTCPSEPLEFTAQGVGTRQRDGAFKLLIPVVAPAPTGSPLGVPTSAPGGPSLASPSEMRENLASRLNGTWVCVAAEAGDKKYTAQDVWPWELRLEITDDTARFSYIGEDLRRHEVKADFLLDIQANPPRFIIEAEFAAWAEKTRLGGPAAVDRGRLRAVALGGEITLNTVNRKDAPPLTALEFTRERTKTEPRTTGELGPPTDPASRNPTPTGAGGAPPPAAEPPRNTPSAR